MFSCIFDQINPEKQKETLDVGLHNISWPPLNSFLTTRIVSEHFVHVTLCQIQYVKCLMLQHSPRAHVGLALHQPSDETYMDWYQWAMTHDHGRHCRGSTLIEKIANQQNKVPLCLRGLKLSNLLMILWLISVNCGAGKKRRSRSNTAHATFLKGYDDHLNETQRPGDAFFYTARSCISRQMLTMHIHKQNKVSFLHSMSRYKM